MPAAGRLCLADFRSSLYYPATRWRRAIFVCSRCGRAFVVAGRLVPRSRRRRWPWPYDVWR